MVTVTFIGGPRDGQKKEYRRNPKAIGCVDEYKAARIPRGLYKVPKGAVGPNLTAHWVEV